MGSTNLFNGQAQPTEPTPVIVEPSAAETERYGKPSFCHAVCGSALWDAADIEVKAHIPGLVYAGALNGLVGPPKAGKTTFAVAKALEYLEHEPTGPVLFITEQSDRSFKAQLKRLPNNMGERLMKAKLPDGRPAFFVMTPKQHYSPGRLTVDHKIETDWDRNLRLWADDVRSIDPSILMMDTFNRYAELKEGGENDGPMILSRLGDLSKLHAVKDSLGILTLSHSNKKADGKTHLSLMDIRGSSAYAGGLDHIVLLNRQPGKRICYMTVESRLTDSERFTMTLQPDGTYLRGDGFEGQAGEIRTVALGMGGKASRDVVGTSLKLSGEALKKALQRASGCGAVKIEGDYVIAA